MMSENSLSGNFMTLQKNITKRRKWLVVLTFVIFILYDVAVLALHLTNCEDQNLSRQAYDLLKGTDINAAITFVIAAITGIEGFAWLDSKVKLDFYESQPFSRKAHFIGIVVNSLVIFIAAYLIAVTLGIAVAGGMGAFSAKVAAGTYSGFARNLFLYLAVFSISALAIMLTGTLVIAVIADIVLLCYEMLFDLCMHSTVELIPTMIDGNVFTTHDIFNPFDTVGMDMRSAILHCIVTTLIAAVIAIPLYRHRRAEYAGRPVPLKPVRIITKIAVIYLGALLTGLVFNDSGTTGTAVISMVISAIVIGGAMEAIYHADIRAVFRGIGFSLIGGAAAILVLTGCIYDFFGYSKWIPDPSEVESAYVYSLSGASSFSTDLAMNVSHYMKLTDTKSVNALLEIGEETARAIQKNGISDYSDGHVDNVVIRYRMKNGKRPGRMVTIPASAKDILNKVMSSDEFKEGYFMIYHDVLEQKYPDYILAGYNIVLDDAYDTKEISGDAYNELKEAYKKDLENYSFDLEGFYVPLGEININMDFPLKLGESIGVVNNNNYKNGDERFFLPVYKSFTNTIAVLKKYNLYKETSTSPEDSTVQMPFYTNPRDMKH